MSAQSPKDPQAYEQVKVAFDAAVQQGQGTETVHQFDKSLHITRGNAHMVELGEDDKNRIASSITDVGTRHADGTIFATGEARSTIVKVMPSGEIKTRKSNRPAVAQAIANRALRSLGTEPNEVDKVA